MRGDALSFKSLSKSSKEKQQKAQRAVRLNKRHLYSPPLTSALTETNQSVRTDRLIDRRYVRIRSYSCRAQIQGRGVLLTMSVSCGAFVSQPGKYIATGVRKAVQNNVCTHAHTHNAARVILARTR